MNITNPYRHTKFTPSSIDGLDLWLDASDSSTLFDATTGGSTPADNGSVARWEDKSGNNNHATQSTVADRPLRRAADVNGRDAVDFVSQDIMIGTSPLTQRQTDEKTAFIVLETDTLGGGLAPINLYSHTSSFTTGAVGLITPEVAYRCGGPVWVSSSPVSTTSPSIVSMTHDGQANIQDAISMWVDGTSATNDLGTDGAFVDNNNGWHLGRQATQVADAGPYDGRICEVIIYNSELSTEDRESVETYLADKWGVISNSINSTKPKFNTFGRASRKFNGTDSVIIGDVLDEDVFTKDSFSISFWAKRDTEDSVQYLFDKMGASLHSPSENQRQFGCNFRGAADDYRLSFSWYGSLSTSNYRVHRTTTQVRVSDGWNHFTISYNKYDPVINDRLKIYKNGVEDVEIWLLNGAPQQMQNGTARLAIGGSVGSVGSDNTTSPLLPLTGSMADVRLYDKVLSSDEANLLSNGHPVNDQLVGHWLTNEDDLEDHAVSVLNNEIPPFSTDGPLPGNASFGDTSRIFDNVTSGTRKIVRIKDFPEMPTGAQTWTAWVKLDGRDNNGNGQDVFTQWDYTTNQKGIAIYIPQTGKPRFYIGDNSNNAISVESAVTFNSNVWYHIAGTYDPSNSLKIYINGSLSNTNTSSIPSVIKNSSVDIEIGSRDSINDLFLAGKITDCRIYDADIGATAIAELAAGTDYRTNLIGQWLTNSNDLLDHSGNDRHAYLLHDEVVKHHADNIQSPEFSIEGPLPNNKTFGKNSLKFNGLNDKVDLGDVLSFEPNMSWTISAWAKADPSQTGTQWIAGRGRYNSADREMAIYWSAIDDKFRVQRGVGSTFNTVSSTNTFSAGSWHHVVGTYDGSTLELFVDGKSEATGASTLNITSTNTFQIGRSPDDGAGEFHWRGNIADVRIYDDVISEESISAIADGIHIQDNLVGWWGVNEKSLRNFANTYRSKYSTDSPFIDTSNFASRYFNANSKNTNPLEYVAIPNNSDIPKGEQTWSVWAKLNINSTGGQSIIGQWGNSGNLSFIVYHIANKLSVVISGNGSTTLSSGDITLNQIGVWHHIAFTFTPNDLLNVYVNGVLEKSVATTISSLHSSTADLRFGRMDRSYNAAFNGNISDVRMYDADIGAGVIASLANGEDYRTNLKGQWLTQFNNLLDYAGTNDGINNFSTFSNDNPFATELDFASRIFDGIDDHVNLGDALGDVFSGTGAKWTISTWIKANDLDGDIVFSKWDNNNQRSFFIRITSSGDLGVNISSDGTTANRWGKITNTAPISANAWYHIAVSYDQSATGNYLRLWVGGVEQTNLTDYLHSGTFTSIYNSNASLQISGIDTVGTSQWWPGNIADVRVYDTVISDIAILNLSQGIDYLPNLVGRWLTNSDDVDDYAGTNHGTNYESIYSKGANPFNQIGITSRTLDGINDYITIPDINESTTNLSVALWVKTTDVDWVTTHLAHWRVLSNNRAWWIGPSRTAETNGKKLMVYLSGDGDGIAPIKRYYGTTDVSDGTWHHVAFTWNNGTLKLFVDGSQETTTKVEDDTMTAIHDSDGPITVGCTWVNDAPANYGSGGRADIRIYNSTLSASDVTDLYNGVDVQTGLAGHWLTNNNDDVNDYAGTNHGTNYGSSFNFENYNVQPTKFGVASRMFDGIDNQISIPDINENVNNLTVLFWLKTTENHWDRGLFSHWDINNNQKSWIFTLSNNTSNDGKGLSIVTSSNGSSIGKRYYGGSVVSDGTWHHCGMTWDNGTLKLFVDGVEETVSKPSDGAHGSLFNSSGKITINGSKDGDNPLYLTKASMADCRIYNTTLSEGEILSIKSGEDNILNKNSLVGHWLTNVDSFNDFSGSGNHALPTISDGSFGGSQYSTQGPAS